MSVIDKLNIAWNIACALACLGFFAVLAYAKALAEGLL